MRRQLADFKTEKYSINLIVSQKKETAPEDFALRSADALDSFRKV